MNIVNGQLELFQDEVKIKHITLSLIMEYVNRLCNTRRVHRNLEYISKEVRDQFLFDKDAYGDEGMFYWRDDLQESYYNFNDRGCMPSLILPFYIEKEDEKYFLKVQEYTKGNDGDSLRSWLKFLHETLFYPSGVYSVGHFEIENSDFDQHHSLTFTKEGMNYTKRPEHIVWESQQAKIYEYPILFDYISDFIEKNNLETFDFDEKNYKWEKQDKAPRNSYLATLQFIEKTLDRYDDEFDDYDGIIYQPELTRILFCEEDIAEIDEDFLGTSHVGEYHEIISSMIDTDEPEYIIANFNLRRAVFNESDEDYLFQSAFYKANENNSLQTYDDINMDILKEIGYTVDDKEKMLEELICSIVRSGIRFLDYKMYMCQKENGVSISWEKY